jgi:membrane protein implicated in regulation of membrane protease activity
MTSRVPAGEVGTGCDSTLTVLMEDYATVSASVIGCVGTLILPTRGADGAGEVLLTVRGSREVFMARSDEPLPKGTQVLVVGSHGPRTVVVEPWQDPTQIP